MSAKSAPFVVTRIWKLNSVILRLPLVPLYVWLNKKQALSIMVFHTGSTPSANLAY